jgi:hypothetical protein
MKFSAKAALAITLAFCPVLAIATDHTISTMTHSGKKVRLDVENMNGRMMALLPAEQAPDYLHQMIFEVMNASGKHFRLVGTNVNGHMMPNGAGRPNA